MTPGTGVLEQKTYKDAGGTVVATVTYASNGTPIVKLAATLQSSDEEMLDANFEDQAGDSAAELVLASAATREEMTGGTQVRPDRDLRQGITIDRSASVDPLMFAPGAIAPERAKLDTMFGPSPAPDFLAQALFVGGIVLPSVLAGKARQSAVKLKEMRKPSTVSTFDLFEDRFESVADDLDAADFPSAMHSDAGVVDWIATQ